MLSSGCGTSILSLYYYYCLVCVEITSKLITKAVGILLVKTENEMKLN